MDVKKGYSLTMTASLPQDWELISIGELFDFKNGLNREKKFFGQGTPIVNYMDVYHNRWLTEANICGKVSLSKSEINSYEVRKGDVFFTRTSETIEEVGLTSVVLDELVDTVFSGFILRARPKNEKLDDNFKKYCFSSFQFRNEITSRSTYTTRALTNGRVLSNIKILIPSLKAEQRAIAEALSDMDALIEAQEALIAKKRAIKQGVMQELLSGKRRLPGFSEEWKWEKVSQFGEVVTGGTPPTNEQIFWNGSIPWITPTDIKNKKDIFHSEREITQDGLNVLSKLPMNSILITCIASIGKNTILRREGACNQQINAIIPNQKHNPDFVYYLFENNKQYLINNAGTTATPIISKKTFSELVFLLPPIEEQSSIAAILSCIDTELDSLEKKLDKTKALKQGMMQELLTGRIRLTGE